MMTSKIWYLSFLVGALAGCGGKPLQIAPDVALKHQYDAAFQRQAQLLQAEQVKVSTAAAAGGAKPAVLMLEVIIPRNTPEQRPDTLKQQVHKLAHLLVADLASPDRYQAINAQTTFSHGLFAMGHQPVAQVFIYSTASLR
ncbi:MAG: hypothetical protein EOO59_10535 [Hymenobacter sp.]|nr:MAG: hypothetical protein EOO59_10535 [Hymenobacter sp.]